MSEVPFASYFDHTLLKSTATESEIQQLCQEALDHKFYSVCVNPAWVPACRSLLKGSEIEICTVVGFPLGANASSVKIFEAQQAIENGATEIDCVLNIGFLKSGRTTAAQQELVDVVRVCKGKALTKIIVESGMLTTEELQSAIQMVNESGAEFIKTSTGFAATGATPEAVQLMKSLARPGLKIKASGGIRTAEDFQRYVDLGVHRIGASQSVAILESLKARS